VCAQIIGPRILQSIFAGIGDFYLYKLTKRFFGRESAFYAVRIHASSIVRALMIHSNSFSVN
jgi:hypothetical protein